MKSCDRVKKGAPTATCWGQGKIYGIAEMTICKLAYRLSGSLGLNDRPTSGAERQRRCRAVRRMGWAVAQSFHDDLAVQAVAYRPHGAFLQRISGAP